ncbi:MAG: hypothetical protein H2172_07680 [Opitutus sp.]|nr:hypothetical protein [Opitutus sp.]MCS6245913.1 hypothetical protein [Opitutus sp.]MCS6272949.1 hypothetical protein [Opitutus sp.]MCS6276008.1 hypothetical protein [Opitutus sp.]MCS6301103.1 hypothetical protein [Opitutus sp.]
METSIGSASDPGVALFDGTYALANLGADGGQLRGARHPFTPSSRIRREPGKSEFSAYRPIRV